MLKALVLVLVVAGVMAIRDKSKCRGEDVSCSSVQLRSSLTDDNGFGRGKGCKGGESEYGSSSVCGYKCFLDCESNVGCDNVFSLYSSVLQLTSTSIGHSNQFSFSLNSPDKLLLQHVDIKNQNTIHSGRIGERVWMGSCNYVGVGSELGDSCSLRDNNFIGRNVIVSPQVSIASFVVIHDFVRIGQGVSIGNNVTICPNTTILEYSDIPDNSNICQAVYHNINLDKARGGSVTCVCGQECGVSDEASVRVCQQELYAAMEQNTQLIYDYSTCDDEYLTANEQRTQLKKAIRKTQLAIDKCQTDLEQCLTLTNTLTLNLKHLRSSPPVFLTPLDYVDATYKCCQEKDKVLNRIRDNTEMLSKCRGDKWKVRSREAKDSELVLQEQYDFLRFSTLPDCTDCLNKCSSQLLQQQSVHKLSIEV